MTWLDLTIIYLACGAPFAVYRVALSEFAPAETAVRSVRAGLLWPIVGAKTVVKMLGQASRSLQRPSLEMIRSEMEAALLAQDGGANVFAFREIFDRYAGLAAAVNSEGAPPAAALFEVEGHPSPAIGQACLSRIRRQKSARHLTAARDELGQHFASNYTPRLDELTTALARHLADDALNAVLRDPAATARRDPEQRRAALAHISGSAS
jgi:hypothetical protein